MSMEHGVETGEICNRDGCKGIIDEHESDGGCSCHCGNPPCAHCVDDRHYCPECDWSGLEEQQNYYKKKEVKQAPRPVVAECKFNMTDCLHRSGGSQCSTCYGCSNYEWDLKSKHGN